MPILFQFLVRFWFRKVQVLESICIFFVLFYIFFVVINKIVYICQNEKQKQL